MKLLTMMVWKIKKINKCIYELKYENWLKKQVENEQDLDGLIVFRLINIRAKNYL
ncbi:unnamed protein product (macronuclear) [Paramecium tetraurelia]|uniref:Uncharacterized protein n=1 Tax=Paramecium tetraurelia TaxID=5888 RepID=A0BW37_PARTE|nr:uncharacterized protein GSPATT00032606001 [Paramecium tetraurelia]CAK62754.1 unnamed protein product [Paramecium tetraurelia]|eukprot:XP_001430152.1 hypothetical protein (macronuclear) [Paramecium tetraurelia strain d4-2]